MIEDMQATFLRLYCNVKNRSIYTYSIGVHFEVDSGAGKVVRLGTQTHLVHGSQLPLEHNYSAYVGKRAMCQARKFGGFAESRTRVVTAIRTTSVRWRSYLSRVSRPGGGSNRASRFGLVRPFLSFLSFFFPGSFPIGSFPLSRPVKKKRLQGAFPKGSATQSGPFPKKVGNPWFGNPPVRLLSYLSPKHRH